VRTRIAVGLLVVGLMVAAKARSASPLPLTLITPLATPIALAPAQNGLIVSGHYPTGNPNQLDLIDANGAVTPFSSLAGMIGENSIAQKSPGHGYVFANNPELGCIGRVSRDGSVVTPHWAIIPGETSNVQTVAYSHQTNWGGGVFALTRSGNLWTGGPTHGWTLLASLGPVFWEGLTFVPNHARYGPFAGAILALHTNTNVIAAITKHGNTHSVARFTLDGLVEAEQIVVVPQDPENGYLLDYHRGNGRLYGIASTDLEPYRGELIALDERAGTLVHLWWDGAAFQHAVIATIPGGTPEELCFSKIGISPLAGAQ
jgi:hypothetical protein